MEFISGKEQRVLGIVEFVILLVENFVLDCFSIRTQNVSDNESVTSTSSGSSAVNEDADAEETNGNEEEKEIMTTPARIFENVVDFFKFLQLSIFGAILVLLHKDVQQCKDPTTFIPIYLGFAVIEFNLFFYLTKHRRFKKYFEQEKREREEEVENTANSVFDKISIFHRLASSKIKGLCRLEARFVEFARRHGRIVGATISVMGFVMVVLISLCSIALAVLSIYFLVTSIYLAIPGENYEAMCEPNDLLSRNVMLSIPIIVVINYSIRAIDLVLPRLVKLNDPGSLHVLKSVVHVYFQILTTVLYIILAARTTKTWRGEEFSLYEFIAMGVSLPTIDALLE